MTPADSQGIYVHIPFCRKKCAYCDFFSGIYSEEIQDAYVSALAKQIKNTAFGHNQTHTVYIGGGTPSSLSSENLVLLLSSFKNVSFSEFTVEANPESIDEDKLRILKGRGCNRISIGVQSFDDKYLKLLGRLHNSDEAKAAVELAHKYFDNISIDLIFGIPGQTLADINNDLDRALSLSPAHISYYSLIYEQGTELYAMRKNHIVHPVEEDIEADMFIEIGKRLENSGFTHYEISNFAKRDMECRHNLNYWAQGKYYGFGAGAVGFDGEKRYKIVADVKEYTRRILNGESVTDEFEDVNPEFEKIMLGLRTKRGLDFSEIKDFENKYKTALKDAVLYDLIKVKGKRIMPTDEGMLKNNELCLLFLK